MSDALPRPPDDRERGYRLIEILIAAGGVPDLERCDERTLTEDPTMMKILAGPPRTTAR